MIKAVAEIRLINIKIKCENLITTEILTKAFCWKISSCDLNKNKQKYLYTIKSTNKKCKRQIYTFNHY